MRPYPSDRALSWRWGYLAGAVLLVAVACARLQGGSPTTDTATGAAAAAQAPAALQQASLAGPIADFAPVQAVVTHADVDEMAPQLAPLLSELIGARHRVDRRTAFEPDPQPGDTSTRDESLVWIRDYQPLFVREPDGELTALLYLSENPNRSEWREALPGRMRTRSLPILHENGNLVSTGRHVFVTELLYEDNARELTSPHLLARGYRARGPRELRRLLARAVHLDEEDVIVLPRMPYEGTGHVDVFVLPLDPNTVAIPQIEDEALALISGPAQPIAKVVQVFLDEQADEVAARGIEVLRLSMIPPALAVWDEGEEGEEAHIDVDRGEFELLVFTPANSLLFQVAGRRVALLPGFSPVTDDPALTALIARYHRSWRRELAKRGWEPELVDASELVGHLGLLRCVTACLPE